MDETTEQLLARLEQATSADTLAPQTTESLDEETVRLRASWLALEKLIKAVDAESQKSEVKARPRVLGMSKQLQLLAALAASLLVAMAVWTIMKGETDVIDPTPKVAVPNGSLPESAPVVSGVAKSPVVDEPSDVVDEFTWEDSFDEQLAAASQAIRSVQADWNGGDRRYSVLLDQLEQFNDELSEGSL